MVAGTWWPVPKAAWKSTPDESGPHSRGVHCLWFVDGEFAHLSTGTPDSDPTNPNAAPGINDVKSGSDGTALNGTMYADW